MQWMLRSRCRDSLGWTDCPVPSYGYLAYQCSRWCLTCLSAPQDYYPSVGTSRQPEHLPGVDGARGSTNFGTFGGLSFAEVAPARFLSGMLSMQLMPVPVGEHIYF